MKTALSFLRKIKKNNNTPWMHAHKDEYLAARKEFEFLVQELIARLSSWDDKLPFLEPKDCVFRFNRDTRFSENKKPYKEHFGAFFAYGGRKGGLPGYYVHVAPDEVFIAGGVWMPEAEKLQRLRRHIAENGEELRAILQNRPFKKVFPVMDSEQVLKRAPKGFPADHEFVEYLKHKSFTVSKALSVKDATAPGFGKVVEKHFKLIQPFNEFLLEGLR